MTDYKKRLLKIKSLLVTIPVLCLALISVYLTFKFISFDPSKIEFVTTSSKIYDRNGEFLWGISKDNAVKNTPVKLETVPSYCIDAVVAVEDKTFWENIGVDINGMGRLLISIFTNGSSGGGSTISQQVIKNYTQNIYSRDPLDKVHEILYAIRLNSYYSKEEILEMYLNNIYFGNLNYGIESASLDYFGKSSKDLNLSECSYLMGIPQWPGVYNPHGDASKGIERQKTVLAAMQRDGYITSDELKESQNYELKFNITPIEVRAPHFVQFVHDQIAKEQGEEIYKSLNINTTYNYSLHKEVLQYLKSTVESHKDHNVNNSSVVILNKDNEIEVMIGSVNFFNDDIDGKFNSAMGLRQPGTSIIPIFFKFALDSGKTFDTSYGNFPFEVTVQREDKTENILIKNFKDIPGDELRLRDALNSIAVIPSVNLTIDVASSNSLENIVAELDRYRYFVPRQELNTCNNILIIEGCEISLLDLTRAYALNFVSREEVRYLKEDIFDVTVSDVYNENSEIIRNELKTFQKAEWIRYFGDTINDKDIFAFAFNENYTIGIWMGNTKGEEMNNISSEVLDPVLDKIIEALDKDI